MTSMFSVAGFALVLALFVARYVIRRYQDDVRHAPGPSSSTASWIWGHELEAFQGQAVEFYSKWIYKYGPLIRIKAALFHSDILVVGDHAAAQQIFADTYNYVKAPSFRPIVKNILGKGLVWAEGDDHAHQRRMLSNAFTPENLKDMTDDILECASKFESYLSNLALLSGGSVTTNIVPLSSACTLDIIGRVAFGHDFDFGKSVESQDIAASWHNVVNTGMTFGGFVAPIVIRAFPFITSLPVKSFQAQGDIKVITGKFALQFIQEGSYNEKRKNILSILLRAQNENNGEGLSTTQIIDNIITFTIAGLETTAGAINFTLLELARHPDVQRKLRDEVTQYSSDLSYDSIQKLSYLDAVVKEGLRVNPPAVMTERVAMKDSLLPLTTPIRTRDGKVLTSLRVKKGQVFHIPFLTMHTNPHVWGVDAAEFKPERWLTSGAMPSPNELPHGWSSLVAFCDGPRNCIGHRLALFEFKIILATLIRSLEFHPTDAVITRKNSPTLQPVINGKGGILPLRVSLLSHS
ncbi:cytochrome P450 [Rickenella mellea]|uniref:Cytochrome P450 n=1 Tax=Rickenella mellea TaxID=50990 RepID=A0A4Y7Q8Z1_9AGAM|nr:cytochrome P450 [Rickenella mellea]